MNKLAAILQPPPLTSGSICTRYIDLYIYIHYYCTRRANSLANVNYLLEKGKLWRTLDEIAATVDFINILGSGDTLQVQQPSSAVHENASTEKLCPPPPLQPWGPSRHLRRPSVCSRPYSRSPTLSPTQSSFCRDCKFFEPNSEPS